MRLKATGLPFFVILRLCFFSKPFFSKRATKTNLKIPFEKESTPDTLNNFVPPILERKGQIIKFSASLQTNLKFLHIYYSFLGIFCTCDRRNCQVLTPQISYIQWIALWELYLFKEEKYHQ